MMIRLADISAAFAKRLDAITNFFLYLLRVLKRKRLSIYGTEESDLISILLFQLLRRYRQGMELDRLPDIKTDIDQIRQNIQNMPARMEPDRFSGIFAKREK